MKSLRFRQVHLDFHTSEHIPGVGAEFDAAEFVGALQRARVDAITLFAKCHHGWCYYDTRVGQRHPQLRFDLLRAQYEACQRADIAVQIYLTAGWDERIAFLHPEWRQVAPDGTFRCSRGRNLVDPNWKDLCFNTPYLDHLCAQIREVATAFPDAAGLFLDIVRHEDCCCTWCRRSMTEAGLDWTDAGHRRRRAIETRDQYYRAATAAARAGRADVNVFHNTSHLAPGDRSILPYFSHFELESLPTGGWGYDHLPMSAAFARTLGKPYSGMTGKFHTFWGEYGGYKHPNALRYECSLMLALGAACSIGDQLDPTGRMDPTTYGLIASAYREVEEKEPWCTGTTAVADVAVFSPSGYQRPGATDWEVRQHPIDAGCARLLLESQLLFDVVDRYSDLDRYPVLILPDVIRLDDDLAARITKYIAGGGKVLMTGESGLRRDGPGFAVEVGAEHLGRSEFDPDYMLPVETLRPEYLSSPMVMYAASQRIRATTGESLGQTFDPYFNRSAQRFCNHLHTPRQPQPSGHDCGVMTASTIYLAYPVFSLYRDNGSVALKHVVRRAIDRLLGSRRSVSCSLPSYGRITLRHHAAQDHYVVHLLCAAPMSRGTFRDKPIEVIEDRVPVHDVAVRVRVPRKITRAVLQPQGKPLPLRPVDGGVEFLLDVLDTHQMVVLE